MYSVYALAKLLEKILPDSKIKIASDGISRLSANLNNFLSVKMVHEIDTEETDMIVVLDANNLEQLGKFKESVQTSRVPIVAIDHHFQTQGSPLNIVFGIFDENAKATCEIIYDLYKALKIEIERDVAEAIFIGLVFDTNHFLLANAKTFLIVTDLIKNGLDPESALKFFYIPMEKSERIARIKASQRAKVLTIGEWLIALSHVNSYQASAARALVNLGFHLSIVGGQKKDKVRISLRCTRDFHERSGIHLARDLAEPVGKLLNGVGGGHSTSAGINGYGKLEDALRFCATILKEKLETTKR